MTGVLAVDPAVTPLRGTLRVPGDKSIAHRALLLAALAHGETRVAELPDGEDVRSTRRCLEALGVRVHDDAGDVVVEGEGGAFTAPAASLDCGNSGTTMRLLAGILASRDIRVVLDGDASLRRRPMRRIAEPLRAMGARITLRDDRLAPIHLEGSGALRGLAYDLPVASAQLKSALILAALGAHGTTVLGGAISSRDHTERMLPVFGGAIALYDDGTLSVEGRQTLRAPRGTLRVPGDISSASYWIAAATIVPGSRVQIADVGMNPTRLGFIDVLRRMGASISLQPRGGGAESIGTIVTEYAPLRATSVEAAEVPALIDELPLLAVIASFAEGTTTIRGAEELRHKESDRIDAIVRNGSAIGMEIVPFDDGFAVTGPARLRGSAVDAMGDHRIAMALAIAALGTPGGTRIGGANSVAISYPQFFSTLEGLRV